MLQSRNLRGVPLASLMAAGASFDEGDRLANTYSPRARHFLLEQESAFSGANTPE
jgi:hypothetical protein